MKLLKKQGLLILVSLLLIVAVVVFLRKEDKELLPSNNYQELVLKIDSMNNRIGELSLVKDSLQTVIDSSKVEVEIINNWYEKELIDITNQSIASDVVFFTNYVSEANKRLVNSNNSSTTKDN